MAVMASHPPESAILDEKPLKMTSPEVEKDGRNGSAEVNGHVSPVNAQPVPDSDSILSATENNIAKTEANLSHNEEAFTKNKTVSADTQARDQKPEPDSDALHKALDSKPEKGAEVDTEMADAQPDAPEAGNEGPTSPQVTKSGDEPATSTKASEPSPSDTAAQNATQSTPSKSEPAQEASATDDAKPDVEMKDAPAPSQRAESTQDTNATNATAATPGGDSSLRPEEMSGLSIDVAPATAGTADTSMTDLAQSPVKVSREREDDGEEREAKRLKIDTQPTADEIKATPSGKPDAEKSEAGQDSLVSKDGEPKNLADASLDDKEITQYQARKIRGILAGIKKTKAGANFKLPVEVLWPGLWQDYLAKVPEPTDIGTMEKRLKGGDPNYKPYATLGDFKKDLQRLYDNSIKFNGEVHEVTRSAQTVRDQVLEKMAAEPATEVARPDKRETVKHHPSRQSGPRAPPQPPPPPRRPSKVAASSPADKPVESPAFAIPPGNNGVPLIRRDSTKNTDDRPKRPIHPPKNKDLGYEPKKKKKLSPDLRFCDEVLTELKKAKYFDFNQDFLAPVDPIALNIPNYHKIVKKPMDLQTMTEKLYTAQYSSPKEFEKDFHQIIKNCRIFNGDDHFVTHRALELEGLFKREWARKDDWMAKHAPASIAAAHVSAASPHDSDEDDAESEAEADDEKEHSSATLEALQRRLDEENDKLKVYMNSKNPDMGMVEVSQSLVVTLQKQIIQERQKLAAEGSTKKAKPKPAKSKKVAGGNKKATGFSAAAGTGGAGGASSGAAGKKAGGGSKKAKRVIGALEKEIIATAVPSLDGDLLNRAIDIIKRDTNENENDSGELELDLEILSVDALTKLYDISIKAFPHLKAEKERNLAAPPPPQDAPPVKSKSSGKPKKNKPMSKAEQERRLQQLNDLKASIKNRGSGSQEPMESIEGNGGSANDAIPEPIHDSDEESSEEE